MMPAVLVLPEPVWMDPPEAITGGEVQYTVQLAPVRRLLRTRPGQWAMIARATTSTRAAKLATNIRAGKYGFKHDEVWETVSRMLDDDSGTYGVFCRWHGPDASDKRPDIIGVDSSEPAECDKGGGDSTPDVVVPDRSSTDLDQAREQTAIEQGEPCGDVGPRGMPCRLDAGHEPPHKAGRTRSTHVWPEPPPEDVVHCSKLGGRCPHAAACAAGCVVAARNSRVIPPARVETDPEVELPAPRCGPEAIEQGSTWPTDDEVGDYYDAVPEGMHVVEDADGERLVPNPPEPDAVAVRLGDAAPLGDQLTEHAAVVLCTCGHSPGRAHEPDDGPCKVWNCDCTGVTLAQAL